VGGEERADATGSRDHRDRDSSTRRDIDHRFWIESVILGVVG
jgi:hypothetical protein